MYPRSNSIRIRSSRCLVQAYMTMRITMPASLKRHRLGDRLHNSSMVHHQAERLQNAHLLVHRQLLQ